MEKECLNGEGTNLALGTWVWDASLIVDDSCNLGQDPCRQIHSQLKWELGFIQMSKYAVWLPTFSSEKGFYVIL